MKIRIYHYQQQLLKTNLLLYVYSFLTYYSDTTESSNKEKSLTAEKLNYDISKKLSFIDVELLSKDYEYVKSLLDGDLEEYKFYFEKLFRYKNLTLSESEEKIITDALSSFGTGSDAFNEMDNSDVYFESVAGVELTHSNFIKFLLEKKHLKNIISILVTERIHLLLAMLVI